MMDTFPLDDKSMPVPEPPRLVQGPMTQDQAMANAFWPLCSVAVQHHDTGDVGIKLSIDPIEIDSLFTAAQIAQLGELAVIDKLLLKAMQLGFQQLVDVMRVKLEMGLADMKAWREQRGEKST